jgi:excisionase family DNA binding protein
MRGLFLFRRPIHWEDFMNQQFYSVSASARLLSVCRITIYRRINDGEIPSIRLGRKVLIPAAFIDGLVSEALAQHIPTPVPAGA